MNYGSLFLIGSCTPALGWLAVSLACLPLICGGAPVSASLVPLDNSYFARSWQAEDGLPENRVVGITQAQDGYLWVATQGGVAWFDGVRFQIFDTDSYGGWLSGLMQGLLRDSAGRMWLAKELGSVACIDGLKVSAFTPKDGLPESQAARSLVEDGAGNIWISYSKGTVVRLKNGRVETFTTTNGLPPEGVCWLVRDKSGQLWFAKNGQVGVFRNESFVVLLATGTDATRIAPAQEGGIWIATPKQVSRFSESGGLIKLTDFIPDTSGSEPTALFEDRDGAVWVGTESTGLFRCNHGGIRRVQTSYLSILCLTEDREGNLWVGTRGGGLNRVHRSMISLATLENGLPFAGVQSLCQDASGALWAVGNNGTLACQEDKKWVIKHTDSNGSKHYCTCVAANNQGTVWVGTRGGNLVQWDHGNFVNLELREDFQRRSLRALLASSRGDLWITTDATDTIYRLRAGQLKVFKLRSGFRFIRALAEDTAGNIWAGATDGLLVRITGDTLVDETPQPLAHSIRTLYASTNGDLWIGYAGGGVCRLRNGKPSQFSRDQGLPNSYVSQILEDGNDSLWFAGNQGIFKVRTQDFDAVASGAASVVQPFIYGRSEGLQGVQASFDFCPNALRSRDQRLYFSTLSGLAEVRLDYARNNYLPPPVYLERVSADGRVYAAYQDGTMSATANHRAVMELVTNGNHAVLHLPPGLQNVRFDFTALSLTAPDNSQFRYQLEGLDQRWVNADTRRFAEYTHPPPGKYTFHVIACNNDGVWNKTGDSLPVIFEAYFWEKLWFKICLAVFAFIASCGLVFYGLRHRHQRQIELLERQRALELERTRIARDLHDDLGVGLTEIGLLGDLAVTTTGLPEMGRERLQEITGRARTLVSALDEIVWAINPANDSSESLMDYFFPYAQRLLGRAGIRCRLQVAEPLPAGKVNSEKRHKLFYAFKEALNNIIRHSGATEVQVTLAAAGNDLRLCITDNGRGLENNPSVKTSHHGLSGMSERLQRLGGRCEVTAATGGGTTVTFIIPVQPEI